VRWRYHTVYQYTGIKIHLTSIFPSISLDAINRVAYDSIMPEIDGLMP